MSNSLLPLALIAALADNRVIGTQNRLPWHLPEDFRHFKAKTLGKPVIMGRKTWDSLGRPLPGRLNLVVSRQSGLALAGAEVFPALADALRRGDSWARQEGAGELLLIGGAQLYAEALPMAERLYLTRVQATPQGDAWFPEFDASPWRVVIDRQVAAAEGRPAFRFETWTRANFSQPLSPPR